jgi:taurine--2-oxoglutarate transaminase
VSEYIRQKLYELADKHICISDVRGVGHFWALEIVKNRKTEEPFDTKEDKFSGKALMTAKIGGDAKKNGLYLSSWYDTMVITPPLIITEQEVDEARSRYSINPLRSPIKRLSKPMWRPL